MHKRFTFSAGILVFVGTLLALAASGAVDWIGPGI